MLTSTFLADLLNRKLDLGNGARGEPITLLSVRPTISHGVTAVVAPALVDHVQIGLVYTSSVTLLGSLCSRPAVSKSLRAAPPSVRQDDLASMASSSRFNLRNELPRRSEQTGVIKFSKSMRRNLLELFLCDVTEALADFVKSNVARELAAELTAKPFCALLCWVRPTSNGFSIVTILSGWICPQHAPFQAFEASAPCSFELNAAMACTALLYKRNQDGGARIAEAAHHFQLEGFLCSGTVSLCVEALADFVKPYPSRMKTNLRAKVTVKPVYILSWLAKPASNIRPFVMQNLCWMHSLPASARFWLASAACLSQTTAAGLRVPPQFQHKQDDAVGCIEPAHRNLMKQVLQDGISVLFSTALADSLQPCSRVWRISLVAGVSMRPSGASQFLARLPRKYELIILQPLGWIHLSPASGLSWIASAHRSSLPGLCIVPKYRRRHDDMIRDAGRAHGSLPKFLCIEGTRALSDVAVADCMKSSVARKLAAEVAAKSVVLALSRSSRCPSSNRRAITHLSGWIRPRHALFQACRASFLSDPNPATACTALQYREKSVANPAHCVLLRLVSQERICALSEVALVASCGQVCQFQFPLGSVPNPKQFCLVGSRRPDRLCSGDVWRMSLVAGVSMRPSGASQFLARLPRKYELIILQPLGWIHLSPASGLSWIASAHRSSLPGLCIVPKYRRRHDDMIRDAGRAHGSLPKFLCIEGTRALSDVAVADCMKSSVARKLAAEVAAKSVVLALSRSSRCPSSNRRATIWPSVQACVVSASLPKLHAQLPLVQDFEAFVLHEGGARIQRHGKQASVCALRGVSGGLPTSSSKLLDIIHVSGARAPEKASIRCDFQSSFTLL